MDLSAHSAMRLPLRKFGGLLTERRLQAAHTIRGKFNLATIMLGTILGMLGLVLAVAFLQLASRNEHGRVLAQGSLAAAELTASLAESRYYSLRYSQSGDEADMEVAEASLAETRKRLDATREMAVSVDAEMAEAIVWLEDQVEGFENELAALDNSVQRYGPSPAGTALADAIGISGKLLTEQARSVEARLAGIAAQSASDLHRFNRLVTLASIGLIVIAMLLAVAGARLLTRNIAGELGRITDTMTELAAGNREITIPGAQRVDEIGAMARSLEIFRLGANELAQMREDELARKREEEDERARMMHDLAARFEVTVGGVVGGVASASSQLQATANSMADSASEAAGFADSIARSMNATADGVCSAAAAGDQFVLSIGEIGRQAAHSALLARSVTESARQADETVSTLAGTVSEIGQVVALIGSIADRTNLLALNASIEASRGGEAGRGFAVVAAEVKTLANQTRDATNDIGMRITSIQKSTGASVDALKSIYSQIAQLEESAVAIAASVDEQGVASQELARNLGMATDGTTQVLSNVDRARETALGTGSAAAQVLASATELRDQASLLNEHVREFLGFVRK